jgi:hypothetical protein
MTLTEIADRLKRLITVHPENVPSTLLSASVLALINVGSPQAITAANRLQRLMDDYPHGIPPEAISIEVRRVSELAHMVREDLV